MRPSVVIINPPLPLLSGGSPVIGPVPHLKIGQRHHIRYHELEGRDAMADRTPLDGLPAGVKARLRERTQPRWIAPMLATLTDERFSREGWLFEPKLDGERRLVFRHGRDLRLFSRNSKRLNEKSPEVAAAFQRQERDFFIADGKIVTFKNGVTSFAQLQQRMQVEHPPADLFSAGSRCGFIFSTCSTLTGTTPGRSRSGTGRNCFATHLTSRIHYGSRSIVRRRAKPITERRAGKAGRV